MCGIAGAAAPGPVTFHGASAAEALGNRGPDGRGDCRCPGESWSWELVHTRLSIVDLSAAGAQPMRNEDGTLVMAFNGEIYNSGELRRFCEAKGHRFSSSMDGEVILHLWEMEGAAALERLNGIFAVAMANTLTGEVVLARDPLGVKPLFYCRSGKSLWFASDLKALAAAGAPLGSHDVIALAQFLSYLWIPDPRTPFEAARTLEPGRALRWTPDEHEPKLFSYGEPLLPVEDPESIPAEAAIASARERFGQAARRQLMADVPVALMASGGVDSGLIWAATKEELGRAYTIQWSDERGGEGLSQDVDAVKELEKRFGPEVRYLAGENAEHKVLPSSGDLFADPAYDLTRLIAKAARDEGYKVLLSGQGGDELFAGYRRHSVAAIAARLRAGRVGSWVDSAIRHSSVRRVGMEYAARVARAASEPDPYRGYMQLCTYSTAAERARALDCTEAEVASDVVWKRHLDVFDRLPKGLSFLRKAMAVDLSVYLPGLGLAYVDRAGMEYGVEIRVPWLDLDFVRWTLSLPDNVLLRRGRGKWLTRQIAAQQLSPDIAHRPKRPFGAPVGQVNLDQTREGQRGFRQGAYFARANSTLQAFLAQAPVPYRPPV